MVSNSQYQYSRVYSLPQLKLRDSVQVAGWWPRADSGNGMVYIPHTRTITMLSINDSGKATVLGRLTAGGKLWGFPYVAVGPQLGQLCVGQFESPDVYIINIANDSIVDTLVLPRGVAGLWTLATRGTGQILIQAEKGLVLYKSVSEPPVQLTDTPISGKSEALIMIGNQDQFLVGVRWESDLFLVDVDSTWHAVTALNGEDGVWLMNIKDVAVWDNCVYVADAYGPLVLLCPV